jgi:hypothetical protein
MMYNQLVMNYISIYNYVHGHNCMVTGGSQKFRPKCLLLFQNFTAATSCSPNAWKNMVVLYTYIKLYTFTSCQLLLMGLSFHKWGLKVYS